MVQQEAAVPAGSAGTENEIRRIFNRLGFWPSVSLLVLAYLFVSVALRAGRQSITGDEAFNYFLYLGSSFGRVFLGDYDANNHVLYTALAWISVHWFGVNEFNLRLPSLAGAAIFFVCVYRIASFLYGRRPLHSLATVLLAGNPYLLDFFTVARGYGLAISFFSLALLNVMKESRYADLSSRRLLWIAVWSSLSVCTNLGFLFPVLALFAALAVVAYHQRGPEPGAPGRIAVELVQSAFGPFLILTFCVLVMPMHTASRDAFYFGSASWRDTIGSVVSPTLFHNLHIPLLGKWPALFWAIYERTQTVIIPALALLIAVFAVFCLVRRRRDNAALFLTALLFTTLIVGLSFAHSALQVKLPLMRTAVYFVFLMPLPLLALLACERKSFEYRTGLVLLPLLLLLALFYIPQWTARATSDWRYDASTREFAKSIELLRTYTGGEYISIGGSWIFEPALNFYRERYGYTHWKPVARNAKLTDPANYYVIAAQDRPAIQAMKLRVLVDDPISLSALAVGDQPCCR